MMQPLRAGAGAASPLPKIDPTKTHLLKEYKHTSPLLGCRFDPSGQFVFAGARTTASSAGTWTAARKRC